MKSQGKNKKKQVKGVEFVYTLHPFKTEILILYIDTTLNGLRYLKEKYNLDIVYSPEDKDSGGCYGKAKGMDDDSNYHYIIFPSSTYSIQTILHECMHAIFNISRDKGMYVGSDSEEYYTYATMNMVDEVIQRLKKFKITPNGL